MRPSERLLSVARLDDERFRDRKLWAFRTVLMVHLTAGLGSWGITWHDDWRQWVIAPMLVGTTLVALRRHERVGIAIALGCWVLKLASVPAGLMPNMVANHGFLEIASLGLLVCLDPTREDDTELGLEALRWLACILFFWAGLQKVWHGTWFGGEYLAWNVSTGEGFQTVFRFILPEEEIERLMSYRMRTFEFDKDQLVSVPPGPYSVESPLFVLASNLVWITELAVPPLLLWKRTRIAGFALGLAVMVMIELGARELFFGGLFANMLLLFLVRDYNRWLLPLFVAFYAVLLGAQLGFVDLEIPL